MTAGSTLYLPVFMKGGLIWTGDSHAGQGNGEIDLTAIETAFAELNVTINLIKQKPLTWPRLETGRTWIAVGYDKNLNTALDILKQETIKLIMDVKKVSQPAAKKLMQQTWNCPIAEVVNGVQGIYCIVPKNNDARSQPLPDNDNANFFVTTGQDTDIEKAIKEAAMAMINKIANIKKMKRVDVYTLSSFALDCRVAPHESGEKKIHCMMPKNLWVN
jgi:acetamidase/formamidase